MSRVTLTMSPLRHHGLHCFAIDSSSSSMTYRALPTHLLSSGAVRYIGQRGEPAKLCTGHEPSLSGWTSSIIAILHDADDGTFQCCFWIYSFSVSVWYPFPKFVVKATLISSYLMHVPDMSILFFSQLR